METMVVAMETKRNNCHVQNRHYFQEPYISNQNILKNVSLPYLKSLLSSMLACCDGYNQSCHGNGVKFHFAFAVVKFPI